VDSPSRSRPAGRTLVVVPALLALVFTGALTAGRAADGYLAATPTTLRDMAAVPGLNRLQVPAGTERLTYTITYLGVAVARAMLEQLPAPAAGGQTLVRASARTTAFWERFFHIRNTYLTRFDPVSFRPTVYVREIDQKGLRFRWVEWNGRAGGDQVSTDGLPAQPESYLPRGEPDTTAVQTVPAAPGNLFSALWWMRYADWTRTEQARQTIWVDGSAWELTFRRVGSMEQEAPEGKVPAWEIQITFRRLGREGPAGPPGPVRTDHVTRELVRANAVVTFWIEQAAVRRPLAVRVERPKLVVKGFLRKPFEEERVGGDQ
jgi:hypothetical protein